MPCMGAVSAPAFIISFAARMSRACSSSASGLFSANILRFSFICSMLDAPESTTVTPGTLCRKR